MWTLKLQPHLLGIFEGQVGSTVVCVPGYTGGGVGTETGRLEKSETSERQLDR